MVLASGGISGAVVSRPSRTIRWHPLFYHFAFPGVRINPRNNRGLAVGRLIGKEGVAIGRPADQALARFKSGEFLAALSTGYRKQKPSAIGYANRSERFAVR